MLKIIVIMGVVENCFCRMFIARACKDPDICEDRATRAQIDNM